MKKLKKIFIISCLAYVCSAGNIALGLDGDETSGRSEGTDPVTENEVIQIKQSKTIETKVSLQDRKKVCLEFNNKYISYYSEVYRITNCKRHLLTPEEVYIHTRKKGVIHTVDANVIIALAEGEVYQNIGEIKKSNDCYGLEGKFVTFVYGHVYLVKNCKRRGFEYWSDYETFREKTPMKQRDIIPLNSELYASIPEGELMPAKISDDYWGGFGKEGVDIIPIDEACYGVEGKYVSYYERVYKIEKCRKREVKAEVVMEGKLAKIKFRELTSEQWISLPNGKNIEKID